MEQLGCAAANPERHADGAPAVPPVTGVRKHHTHPYPCTTHTAHTHRSAGSSGSLLQQQQLAQLKQRHAEKHGAGGGDPAVARFLESQEDHVQLEIASTALRAAARAAKAAAPDAEAVDADSELLLGAIAAAEAQQERERAEQGGVEADGGAGEGQQGGLMVIGRGGMDTLAAAAAVVGLRAGSSSGSGSGALRPSEAQREGGWASSAFDMFMRETASLLEAIEAQQQRVAGAVLQQQALAMRRRDAAADAPHVVAFTLRGRPMLVNLVGAPGQEGGQDVRMVAAQMVVESAAEPAAAADAAPAAAAIFPSNWLLAALLSAACAGTFVAFVHALVQLRAAMLAPDAPEYSDEEDYYYIPGGDSEDADLAPRPSSRGSGGGGAVARRGSAGDLASPLLAALEGSDVYGAGDLSKAQVLIVVSSREGVQQ
jgi:hypothetical protein